MHAIVIQEHGGPEQLRWAEVPDPEPGPGEVLVDVAATAVNRADLLQRQGFYPPPPGASEILGLECSGTVAALGEGVTGWAVGDEVCALLAGGGYAERVAVPSGQVMSVPRGVDLDTAAALPEVACTVWSNLAMVAGLSAGEVLLVHGGGSGIGTMAIQVARMLGAQVAVTAGSPDKLARCEALGAQILVEYKHQDFVETVRAETAGHGADVVLDNMGAAYLGRNVDVLARGGRLVVIGMQGGVRGELDLSVLLRMNGTLHATSLRGRPLAEKAEICAQVQRTVWPWIESGEVRPVVDRVLPLTEAARAHHVIAEGEAVGKVVLAVPR